MSREPPDEHSNERSSEPSNQSSDEHSNQSSDEHSDERSNQGSNESSEGFSEAIVALLERYEDALAAGEDTEPIRALAQQYGPEAALWFERATATLRTLRRGTREALGAGAATGDALRARAASQSASGAGVNGDGRGAYRGPPARVGRFEIQRTLGRGGFGAVYLAWDPHLRREVALKVAHERTLASDESRKRFAREARIAASLDHPNLVGVYEAGEEDGVPYIASVYCRGETLARWLESRRDRGEPVPARVAASIVRDLALGMAHAHATGVLHRDLKPTNILLEPRPSSQARQPDALAWVPRITDFGLARAGTGAEPHTETRSGAVLGTLRYMAPEQAMGRVREVGPSADVYSLGVILYEMLTGRVPFERDTEFETIQAIARDEPSSVRSVRSDSPRDLDAICLKCLEKDGRRRYASAKELADDLERYLVGDVVRARLPTPLERGVKWLKRRPVATLLGIVLMVAVGLAAVAWNLRIQREQANEIARARAVEQSKTQYVSDIRRVADGMAQLDRGVYQHATPLINLLAKSIPRDGAPDSRGFEWYYFWERLHPARKEFVWHGHRIWDVDWSPDGKLMASASEQNALGIWDAQSARLIQRIAVAEGCSSVAFSPRGDLLAIGSDKGPIHLCAVGSWEVIATLEGHTTDVDYVRFIDGGKTLVSVGLRDKTLRRWDVDGRKQSGLVNTGLKEAWSVHVAGDEKTAVLVGANGIRLLDLATLAIKGQRDLKDVPRGVRFSPDGVYFAVSTIEDGHLVLFETATFREVARWRDGHPGSSFIEFSADGRRVISACGSSLFCWDRTTGRLESAWAIADNGVVNCERTPDGTKYLVTDDGGKMFLLGATLPSNPREVWSIGHTVATDVQWSPDGNKCAVCGPQFGVHVLDARSWQVIRTLDFTEADGAAGIVRCGFSPSGRELVITTQNRGSRRVFVRSVEDGTARWVADCYGSAWNCEFTADGRHILVQHGGDGLLVLRADTGNVVRDFVLPPDRIYARQPPGSPSLLVWTMKGMHEWNPDTPNQELKLLWSAGSQKYEPCLFSKDCRYVAQIYGSRVDVREAFTGKLLLSTPMEGANTPGGSLDFAPDGRTVVGFGVDQQVRLWRLPTGDEVARQTPPLAPFQRGYGGFMVRFSPDGSRLITMNDGNGTSAGAARLLLWNAPREPENLPNP